MAKTSPTQRDAYLAVIERDGVFAWKRRLGYDAQSHAENACARYQSGASVWKRSYQ